MRKIREYTCKECGSVFANRLKNPLCCSYTCSNKYQAELRKSTIDPSTGLTMSALYSKRATEANYKSWYHSDRLKEIGRNNMSELQKSEDYAKNVKAACIKRKDKSNGLS